MVINSRQHSFILHVSYILHVSFSLYHFFFKRKKNCSKSRFQPRRLLNKLLNFLPKIYSESLSIGFLTKKGYLHFKIKISIKSAFALKIKYNFNEINQMFFECPLKIKMLNLNKSYKLQMENAIKNTNI